MCSGYPSLGYNNITHCALLKLIHIVEVLFFFWRNRPPVGEGLLDHGVSKSHTTTHHSRQDSSGREISSSRRPLPDNTQHSQQTSMPPVGFKPTISAGEQSQTYALDRVATGTGSAQV